MFSFGDLKIPLCWEEGDMDLLGRHLCPVSHSRTKLRWAGMTSGIDWCLVGHCPQGGHSWALTSQPWESHRSWEEEPKSM